MTKRERILTVLNRGRPDRVPWCADLSYWMSALERDGLLSPQHSGEAGIFRMHRDVGAGFYLQGFFPFTTSYEGVDMRVETTGNITTTRYETPKGTLTEVWEYIPQTYSEAPREHLVKGIEDFAALRWLYEHTYYDADYDRIARYQELAGDNGVTLCYTPKSPFMELVALKAGIEALTYAIMDDEDEFDATLAVMAGKHLEASALTMATACECVMVPENLSAEVVGKAYFERYMRDYHRLITDKIRAAGKFSFIHMDGSLGGLVNEISLAGFDVVEALTPAPVGDLPIKEIAAQVHPDTVLWGGIPGGFFTDEVDDATFDRFVLHVLEVLTARPNSALGVADQVVPGARFDRIRRVDTLVEQYGAPQWNTEEAKS